jgi:hypothetical protein
MMEVIVGRTSPLPSRPTISDQNLLLIIKMGIEEDTAIYGINAIEQKVLFNSLLPTLPIA